MSAPPPTVYPLLSPEGFADPYPFYRRARAEAPLVVDHLLPGRSVVGYDLVAAALRDPRLSAERNTAAELISMAASWGISERDLVDFQDFRAAWMLFADPPAHTRLRGLVSKAFTPRVVERMRERIGALVDAMLDAVLARGDGRMDVIRDLAHPLPAMVIALLLGLPAEDRERFKAWSNDIAATLIPFAASDIATRIRRAHASQLQLEVYFRSLICQRREHPADDLLSALASAEEQGDVLSERELLATCVLLLIAGHETTTNLIGNGLLALLQHPEQLARVRDEPELLPSAVEELLRYDSPVQGTARRASQAMEFAGESLQPGDFLHLWIGAANRDPSQFPEPDRLDVTRRENRHLSFAHGAHYCLGAALARLEAQIAFGALLRRFPGMRLADDAPIRWYPTPILRGLPALAVVY